MVVGINSHIKMSIGHFPTRSSTADELFPLLWKAVAYLEITCGLKVQFINVLKILELAKLYIINQSEKNSANIIKFPICSISWIINYIFFTSNYDGTILNSFDVKHELVYLHIGDFIHEWQGLPKSKAFTGFTGLETKTWFSLQTIPSPLKNDPSISFLISHTSSKP